MSADQRARSFDEMAVSKSNGVAGGERRRKPRTSAAAARAAEGAWLGRVDALADLLAGLEDRGTIVDRVVSETLSLLPAEQVVVRAEATSETAPSFTEANEGSPARAVIPLVIGGRHFGAVEIAMKAHQTVGPGERTLSIALARQCALALANLALRTAQREPQAPVTALRDAGAAADRPAADLPAARVATAIVGASIEAVPPSSLHRDVVALQAALGQLESDLRALAKLARSAELPPTVWVDQAERKALRRVDELRVQIFGPANPA